MEIAGGKLYLNGKPADEPYLKESFIVYRYGLNLVPPGKLFVLGDNRNNSDDSSVWGFLPVENMLHSPVRFQMEPSAQFKALLNIEEAGQELLAIFHSHPTGPARPSETDVAEFYYPGALVLIASPTEVPVSELASGAISAGIWQIFGFQIDNQRIIAVKLGYSDKRNSA